MKYDCRIIFLLKYVHFCFQLNLQDKQFIVSFDDTISLVFDFYASSYSWGLSIVRLKHDGNHDLKTNSSILASLGNSFHSPSDIVFDDVNYKLTFKGLQVLHLIVAGTNTSRIVSIH